MSDKKDDDLTREEKEIQALKNLICEIKEDSQNKSGKAEDDEENYMLLGIALGMIFGYAIFFFIPGINSVIGISVGMMIGLVVGMNIKKK